MAAKQSTKEQAQRLRVYRANQLMHHRRVARKNRDQWLAGAIMTTAVTLAGIGFWAWAEVGPGSPSDQEVQSALEEVAESIEQDAPNSTESADETATVPDIALSEYRNWDGTLTIDDIALDIELNGFMAPQAVANFISLADSDFYADTRCHRLTTEGIFVLQCGDPEESGQGGPGYRFGPIENAPEDNRYPAGTLAMARVSGDADSMGSQFFIVYDDSTIPADQAGGYTVFGEVTSGLQDLVEEVVTEGTLGQVPDGEPVAPSEISNITIR